MVSHRIDSTTPASSGSSSAGGPGVYCGGVLRSSRAAVPYVRGSAVGAILRRPIDKPSAWFSSDGYDPGQTRRRRGYRLLIKPLTPFVGRHRELALQSVVHWFRDTAARNQPRLVCIHGSLGIGKTRIAQELYKALATDQQYWPPSLDRGPSAGPLSKRIHPAVPSTTSGLDMPWMWWGVSCALRHGVPAQVLGEAITQLRVHQAALISKRDSDQAIRRALISLATFGAGITPIGLISQAPGAVTPLRDAAHAISAHRVARLVSTAGYAVPVESSQHADLVREVLGVLSAIGAARLPMVMVLDDAHFSDRSLISMLDGIFTANMHIGLLCVCTVTPSEVAAVKEQRFFSRWVREAERTGQAVSHIRLEALEREASGSTIRSYAPGTREATVEALVERADGNPLILEALLNSPRVKDHTLEGSIRLEPREIARLPSTNREYFAGQWNALPEDVARALTLAAMQGKRFSRDLLIESHALIRGEARDRVEAAVSRAVSDPPGWARATSTELTFNTQLGFETALYSLHYGDQHLIPAEQDRVCIGLCAMIAQLKTQKAWADMDHRRRLLLLDIHTWLSGQLAHTAVQGIDIASAIESALIFGLTQRRLGDAPAALATQEQAVALAQHLDPEHSSCIRAREHLALTLSILGRHAEAVDQRRIALASRARVLG
ncbi:MAG: hypothetical protein QOE60_3091, partial [Thermoleophilaceae bacterium]|nr:hypothetical protein [Thermoleophilaceae bacterium]